MFFYRSHTTFCRKRLSTAVGLLLLCCLPLMALKAQPKQRFYCPGGDMTLQQLMDWLNREPKLNINYNNHEKGYQRTVRVQPSTYSFVEIFDRYFRPYHFDYKVLGTQLIIFFNRDGNKRRYTISGYIMDAESGERLKGAGLYSLGNDLGTFSNNYGFYSLTLPEGSYRLAGSYIGYDTSFHLLQLAADTTLVLPLNRVTAELSEVKVLSSRPGFHQSSQMSAVEIPINLMESMPKILGETDALRALQFLPGVLPANDASSGLYVRGGSPDQNLILLDGVPVYNSSHLFGMFSVFNTDALQSVELMKGGFPARYGGRLSSVIDIRMKEGNKNEWHGEGSIGLLSSRFTIEGPIRKQRSSLMASVRTTNWKPLIKKISSLEFTKPDYGHGFYGFYDFNLKTNFYISPKDQLYISGYFGRDKLHSISHYENNFNDFYITDDRNTVRWGNITAVARWNHEHNKKLFSNTTLHYSRYRFYANTYSKNYSKSRNSTTTMDLAYSSQVQDLSLRYDVDYYHSPTHSIKTGASVIQHYYRPGNFSLETIVDNLPAERSAENSMQHALELDAYLEDNWRFSSRFKANLGVHLAGFHLQGRWNASLQPRLSGVYSLNRRLGLKASFVTMTQYLHLLANSGIGLPTDLWVPATTLAPAEQSSQVAAGVFYKTDRNLELSVEAYYKRMHNVLEYAEGAEFVTGGASWESRVHTGKGRSYGLELLLQKKKGASTGTLSYTWSNSSRHFKELNEGKPFPFKYDVRHAINITFNHKFSPRREFSANWVFGSGQATTVPLEVYLDASGQQVTVYSERNAFRLPAYHRADISFSFHKQKKHYLRTWVFGLYNVYNRQNPLYIMREGNKLKQFSLLPILPTVNWQMRF